LRNNQVGEILGKNLINLVNTKNIILQEFNKDKPIETIAEYYGLSTSWYIKDFKK